MATRRAPTAPSTRARRRTPVWKEVEERESRTVKSRARQRYRQRRRLAVIYDVEGPRVRLGIGWFLLVMVTMAIGLPALALVFGAAAGLAGRQVARAWRRRGGTPDVNIATAGAAALPLAASVSTAALGLAILAVVGAAIVAASAQKGSGLAAAGLTVQSAVPVGAAAASVLCASRFEIGAAVALVFVVSAYETGDYLIGSGSRNAVEGPVAGIAALLVVQFMISALGIPPFGLPEGLAYAVMAAVCCPLGQITGSLILPSVKAPASALRRLDSLLVLGPLWALTTGIAAAG